MGKKHLYDTDTGATYGNHKSYLKGFILSILITTIAFTLVGFKLLSPSNLCIVISVLAIIQLFVQLIFFLHLNMDLKSRWNLISAIFAIVIVLILLAGTVWIMLDLYNMMM